MRRFFPQVDHRELDLRAIKQYVRASKAFYDDAVDESAADADAEARQAYVDGICALDGFRVRQGTITGKAKKQKRVDVQLVAAEMTLETFWWWSIPAYRKEKPSPDLDNTIYGSLPAVFCTSLTPGNCLFHFPSQEDEQSMTVRFTERDLEQYFLLCRGGQFSWRSEVSPA